MLTPDAERTAIDTAIRDAVARGTTEQTEGGMVTGWLLVAEVVGKDGMRYLQKIGSEDLTMWAARGFLHEALTMLDDKE